MDKPFIDKCISGEAFLDEIDDYVDTWHDDVSESIELNEYLGMTMREYALWITTPSILASIVDARRRGHSLEEAPDEIHALAARASSHREAHSIMEWLKTIGKLDAT